MSKLSRKFRKNIKSKRPERVKAAEEKAFKWLEERWADDLKGNPIPEKHRAVMRRDPAFRFLVAQVLNGSGLHAPDLDQTPVESREADGTPRSLFHEELAGDPRRYLCDLCGSAEIEVEGQRCPDCVEL